MSDGIYYALHRSRARKSAATARARSRQDTGARLGVAEYFTFYRGTILYAPRNLGKLYPADKSTPRIKAQIPFSDMRARGL